ncbi:MAG: metal ABC transporter ATP-binding protein [Candidatus Promineifilaceae bacterium]|nr:metal ABC transporter ATP-binding protein [Candidatus Promineifilaceae bacterium]
MNVLFDRLRSPSADHLAASPTVEIEDVWVAYEHGPTERTKRHRRPRMDQSYALKGINLRVEPGEHIAIVGPNGAGKSTLFRLLAGTIGPSRGRVTVFGNDPSQHICIAYVPQRSQIDWSFPVTVADVVMMGRVGQIGLFRWPRRHDWQKVSQSLRRVGLEHRSSQQIGELSGGQQQRVFIARALAQNADLLLLDEPLTGLDAPSHEALLGVLDDLKSDAVTVLLATHDLQMAAERFPRVILMNRRLIADGAPAQTLETERLLEAYGGHSHFIGDLDSGLVIADSCCESAETLDQ